jgi:fucose permease
MKECGITPINAESSERNLYKQIFGHKTVHYLAFFIFLYVGVEVTIGGMLMSICSTACAKRLGNQVGL